jgi:hypothetical protein
MPLGYSLGVLAHIFYRRVYDEFTEGVGVQHENAAAAAKFDARNACAAGRDGHELRLDD